MLALLAVKLLLPVRQHLTRTYTLTPTAHSLMTHSRRDGLEGLVYFSTVFRIFYVRHAWHMQTATVLLLLPFGFLLFLFLL